MASRMFNPPHPGKVLQGVLDANGFGVEENAASLGISPQFLRAIFEGEADVTPELSVRLTTLLGTSDGLWERLQRDRDEWLRNPRSKQMP